LPPLQNRLDEIRRQQRQSQHAPEIREVDLLSCRQLRHQGELAGPEQPLRSVRSGQRLDRGGIDPVEAYVHSLRQKLDDPLLLGQGQLVPGRSTVLRAARTSALAGSLMSGRADC
jgi:hypothetical protein